MYSNYPYLAFIFLRTQFKLDVGVCLDDVITRVTRHEIASFDENNGDDVAPDLRL